jgi:uncharacterized membrane protein YraQ (UPF0718 family)
MTSTCRYDKKKLEEEYAALSKEINISVRNDYRAYVDSIAKEAQVAANQVNTKGVFSPIRHLTKSARPATVAPIKDKQVNIVTSIQGQIQRSKELLKEILPYREDPVSLPPESPISTWLPLKRKIVHAIMAMKNRTAAGPDNILDEVVKAGPYAIVDILLSLFLDIWQKEKFPNKWNEGIIIKAPKEI